MHLRKTLALGAVAVMVAGLFGLTSTAADASPVAYIAVNGSTDAASVPIDGSFRSGTATFAGSTYGCSTGTTTATVARGAVSAAADLSFKTLSLTCSTPVGNATISLNSCTVPVDFAGATATNGVDTAVVGTATFGSGTCVKLSALSGMCTANVQGSPTATFDETVRSGGWQDLILSNSGTLANQSGCLGLMSGSFTLNNIDFGVRVTSGTTSGIDFRLAAQAPAYYIGVNGITDAGSVPIDGTFDSGTATFAGSTYGCSSGIVAGAVERGDTSVLVDLSFDALSINCNSPLGAATISLNSCSVPVEFAGAGAGATITDGIDTAVAPGIATFGISTCVKVSALGGTCTANVQGTVGSSYDETVTAVGGVNYQDLILNGSGTLANQSGCSGLLTGTFTLNSINFNVRVTGGTTSGIDFRKTLLSSPASGTVAYIGVNGSTASGSVAVDGVYRSGNASFAGSTYGCSAGTVNGTVARGAVTAAADLSFTTLGVTCDTPVGPATIFLGTGCSVPVDFAGAIVYDTTIDTGAGPKYFNVPGAAAFGTGTCVKLSALSGICTANVQGTVNAYFDESVRSVGGVSYQDLILSGTGSVANQSGGCGGALTGTFTLNNIDFRVKVTAGSTSGIDFRVHP